MADYQRSNNNTTSYNHPNESNLWEIHKALEYNSKGQPTLRVSSSSAPNASTTSAFGEPLSVPIVPVIQLDAIYGLNNDDFQVFTFNNGIADTQDSQFILTADSNIGSYSVIRSKRLVRYRPGQGAMCRFACRFTQGVASTTQRAGFFSQEQAFQFGYNGTEFGILHMHGGHTHLEELTITTAPGNGETATVTLNGVDYTVTLANESTQETAARISRQTFPGWTVHSHDNVVTFLYQGALQQLPNSFAFSSTGNCAGTMNTIQEGNASIETWYPQSEWNGIDGVGLSIDPTKFNVYQIDFRWLGAGIISFSLEHPETGELIVLHTIHWVNKNTTLHVENPSFHIGFVAYNYGGTSPVTVYGGSIMGANEGLISPTTYPRGASTTKKVLSSNVLHHLGTLRNPLINMDKVNVRELILDTLSVAFQGNDPLIIYGFIDASLSTGSHLYQAYPDTVAKASLVTGVVDGSKTPVLSYIVPINGSGTYDLSKLRIAIPPDTTFTIAVQSTQSISEIAASLIWRED